MVNCELLDSALIEDDPYSHFGFLREHAPVYWSPRWDAWVISRYEDVSKALRNPNVFASDRATFVTRYLPAKRKDAYNFIFEVYPRWLSGGDNPIHGHMRRIVNTNWTPSKVGNYRARVRATVEAFLDELPSDETIDLMGRFAIPLPANVISSVIGIPHDEWAAIKSWSDDWGQLHFSPNKDEMRWDNAAEALHKFYQYLATRLAQTKSQGGDDYFAKMLTAEFEGDRLNDEEITTHILEQLFAGHETTANLIGNGVLMFMRHREQWDRLCADPSLAGTAVEEALRVESPIKVAARWAKTDYELRGHTIREGQNVLLLIAAANRDPGQFDEPDTFDITRTPNQHLGFGGGIHFCLGAPLARLEGEEVFRALCTRFPKLRLATEDPGELEHEPILRARALKKLPIRLN